MDYKTAARQISKGNLSPIYVCYGAEKYLLQEFLSFLTNRIIPVEYIDFAVSKFDLSETSIDMVIEDAETPAFLAPSKLIIAKEASFLTGAKDSTKVEHRMERLLEYIQKPVESSILVLVVNADKLDERKKVVKLLKEKDYIIPFLPMSSEDLTQWVLRQAERLNCEISSAACERLILCAGTHLQSLSSELEKVALFVGQGGSITPEVVEDLVTRSTEQNVFVLIEEIAQLRVQRALSIYYDLLKQREEPIKLLSLIARQFRIILQVKELTQQSYSQQQCASQLSLHPYAVKIAAEQSRRFETARLCRILSELAELDFQMKTGKLDKVLGLELFLLKMAV